MALVWTICGAGRGVGKTQLASALCASLPHAIYVKYGHGDRQPGKAEHFFCDLNDLAAFVSRCVATHEHVIVEANAWAREGHGDIIVYVGGTPLHGARRDRNLLTAHAHIRLDTASSVHDWTAWLATRLPIDDTYEQVCTVLAAQRAYACGVRVRSKIWFTAGDERVFGFGLANLLEAVERQGTLTGAARVLEISYRHAWGMLKGAERHLGQPLILPHPGGSGGGATQLSSTGRHLLDVFQRVNAEVAAYADDRFRELYRDDEANG